MLGHSKVVILLQLQEFRQAYNNRDTEQFDKDIVANQQLEKSTDNTNDKDGRGIHSL